MVPRGPRWSPEVPDGPQRSPKPITSIEYSIRYITAPLRLKGIGVKDVIMIFNRFPVKMAI